MFKFTLNGIVIYFVLILLPLVSYSQYNKINFIRSWDAVAPESSEVNINVTTAVTRFKMSTQYLDGLGRPIQKVIKKGSLTTDPVNPVSSQNAIDAISTNVYDELGRESLQYLPFIATASGGNTSTIDGFFKHNPLYQQANFSATQYPGETFFYSKTLYETSSLGRVKEIYAPGNNWVGTIGTMGRSIKSGYYFNTATDAVRMWTVGNAATGFFGSYSSTTTYPAGTLHKNITTDEKGKQVIEFKDKDGLLVLKKVQLTAAVDAGAGSGPTGWLCTYYIYDNLNRLRCVIQPKGVELIGVSGPLSDITILDEQCFRYEYDRRNRLIMKKVPGAGEVYMVYDTRDRLIMTQDANMRALNKWTVTLYDNLNRPVQTGLLLNTFNNKTFALHLEAAYNSFTYPFTNISTPAITFWEYLTKTGYDDYNSLPVASGLTASMDNSFNTSTYGIVSPYNASPDYAQQIPTTPSAKTKGLVTWTEIKILGTTPSYGYKVFFFDDKLRTVQVKSKNITGGLDIIITQYNWSGQPIIVIEKQEKAQAPAQTSVVVTKLTYDELGRLVKTDKKIQNSLVNGNTLPGAYTTVSKNEYDALGQIKKKNLGNKPGAIAGTPLVKQDHEYNIRGWLLSVNKGFISAASNNDQYFGFELGYDKNPSFAGTWAGLQFDGSISGTIWKSEGDQQRRKYDYTYDAANRLTGADFNQYVSGAGTAAVFNKTSAGINFKVENLNYDANGNILSMRHYGLKFSGSGVIDDMIYTYLPKSNKLLNVKDFVNDPNTRLGDFKTTINHPQNTAKSNATTSAALTLITDYVYDLNGNLVKDFNKDILTLAGGNGIQYNHLNLPVSITLKKDASTNKGTITYTYDATGNKLRKVTIDGSTAGKTITTTTTYINGFVYESRKSQPADPGNTDYTDVLQFVSQEEGRVRFKPLQGTTPARLVFDYFIKDQLGNVRMVLTEDVQSDVYPTLSFEGAAGSTEVNNQNAIWETGSGNAFDVVGKRTSIQQLVTATTLVPATLTNSLLVRSSTGKTGAGKLLKIMSGDKINTSVQYYYSQNTGNGSASSLSTLVTSLASVLLNSSTSSPLLKSNAPGITNMIGTDPSAAGFFAPQNTTANNGRPKAFLNVLFFDEQFRFDNVNSYSQQIGVSPNPGQIVISNKQAKKNGYCYIYINNESNDMVYFDNFMLKHDRSSLIEETHYYPFGLTMSGISSKAAGNISNREKTFQGQRFDDDLGLNWVQFKWRNHDPQIGRFIEIDPLADKYVYNSTYAFSENKVTSFVELEGLEASPLPYFWREIKNEFQSAANWLDNNIAVKTGLKISAPVVVNDVVTGTNVVIETKSKTTTNLGGNMAAFMNSNSLTGNNEPITKTTTNTTVSLEQKVEVKTPLASGSFSHSIDNNGVTTKTSDLSVKRGSELNIGMTASKNSNNNNNLGIYVSTTPAPNTTVKGNAGFNYTFNPFILNFEIGNSLKSTVGAVTVTASTSLQFGNEVK